MRGAANARIHDLLDPGEFERDMKNRKREGQVPMIQCTSFLSILNTGGLVSCAVLALGMLQPCFGQSSQASDTGVAVSPTAAKSGDVEPLPDAPSVSQHLKNGPASAASPMAGSGASQGAPPRIAPALAVTIEPGYSAVPLDFKRAFMLAGHEVVSYSFPVRFVVSASISQVRKTDPKYGEGQDAFAQRVGAAAARQASQFILSDGLLAPVLHQDPRYYVLGREYGFFHRFVYAMSRVLVTRTSSGGETLNTSTLVSYGGAAAITQLYYPQGHRDIYAIGRTYGLSLVGVAGEHEAQEFFRFLIRGQSK